MAGDRRLGYCTGADLPGPRRRDTGAQQTQENAPSSQTTQGNSTEVDATTTQLPEISSEDHQRLANIQVSVISYSKDDNRRFIMSGNDILREGDQLGGYTIHEIRRNSVVLDVRGVLWELRL